MRFLKEFLDSFWRLSKFDTWAKFVRFLKRNSFLKNWNFLEGFLEIFLRNFQIFLRLFYTFWRNFKEIFRIIREPIKISVDSWNELANTDINIYKLNLVHMERKNAYASIYTKNIETTNTMAHNTQVLNTRVISKNYMKKKIKGTCGSYVSKQIQDSN